MHLEKGKKIPELFSDGNKNKTKGSLSTKTIKRKKIGYRKLTVRAFYRTPLQVVCYTTFLIMLSLGFQLVKLFNFRLV